MSPKGTRNWVLFYRAQTANGRKLRRLTLGRFPALSLADARVEAHRHQSEVAKDGADPAADKRRQSQVITVADMAQVYLDKHARVNKRSWRKDEAILEQDVLPVIGRPHPKEVERAHIETILDRVAARGATTQQNRVFEIVRGLFNWGTGLYVDVPPTFGMKKRVKEQPRERNLTNHEVRTIWHGLTVARRGLNGRAAIISEPVAIALKLLLVTGQRSSEVSQATKAEFDLDGQTWTIPGDRAKNGRSHRVPLSNLAVGLVQRAVEPSGRGPCLFPSPVRTKRGAAGTCPIGNTAPNHALDKVLAEAGLHDIRPHDFREFVATGMMGLSIPEQHVGAVLNHARTSITAKHYARHAFEAEKRAALDM